MLLTTKLLYCRGSVLKQIALKENDGVFHASCVALQPMAQSGESITNDLWHDSSLEIKSFVITFDQHLCLLLFKKQ